MSDINHRIDTFVALFWAIGNFDYFMGNSVYIGLGSNLGDRELFLRQAIELIGSSVGDILDRSSVLETEPWGFSCEDRFLNMVICVETKLSPRELLKSIHSIEDSLGRERKGNGYTSRTIDIDILLYNDDVVCEEDLIIPHPLMHKRLFVMNPLCELCPQVVHPVLHKSMEELRAAIE